MLYLLLIIVFVVCNTSNIKKVAIVGSGVGGLSLAACLKKIDCGVESVEIYEERQNYLQTLLGGGVQITGGANVIERLGLLESLEGISEKLTFVRSRTSAGEPLLTLNVSKAFSVEGVRNQLVAKNSIQPLSFSVMRDALLSLLYNATQSSQNPIGRHNCHVNIFPNKSVVSVSENNNVVSLHFSDGTCASGFDMVVGSDGIRSAVRLHLQKTEDLVYPLSAGDPQYSGIRIAYCVTDPDPCFRLRVDPTASTRGCFHQYFGDGLYALCASYGGLSGPQHMLAVVYRDETDAAQGENGEWLSTSVSTSSPDSGDALRTTLRNRLLRAGFSYSAEASSSEVMKLLDASRASRMIDLGVRGRVFPLRKWSSSSGRVVLLGDSAHAM